MRRDTLLDLVKAISIILVCIGHILQATTSDYLNTSLYNYIYAVQMPMFFIVSGILSNTRLIDTKNLFQRIMKKATSYLMPFFSWSLLFNPVFKATEVNPVNNLVRVMKSVDSGLWFVWVLFFLCVNAEIANYYSRRCNNTIGKFIADLMIYGGLLLPWTILLGVFKCGYLGGKLIIYYSVFYYVGRIYKLYIKGSRADTKIIQDATFLICVVLGVYIISHYPLMSNDDSICIIVLRLISGFSLSYCLMYGVFKFKKLLEKMHVNKLGKYTLEIYYVHGIATSLFAVDNAPAMYSLYGFGLFVITLVVMIGFTLLVVSFIRSNKYTNFIFFGKK